MKINMDNVRENRLNDSLKPFFNGNKKSDIIIGYKTVKPYCKGAIIIIEPFLYAIWIAIKETRPFNKNR